MKKLTLAQRHQMRVRAERESAAPVDDSMAGATTYELQLMQLKQDQHRLKQMQSLDARNQLKPKLLPNYDDYVDGVLKGGTGAADEVLTTVMLWHLDTASFPRGLEIADYVITHKMSMPDRFARSVPTLVAEEIANAALAAYKQGLHFERSILERAEKLTAESDMPDEVRAKLEFALAKSIDPSEESSLDQLQQTAARLREAIRLHERVGAKKDLERVERWIKKHAESQAANS